MMGDKSATFRFHKADIGDCGLAVGAMGFLKTDPRARQPSPPSPKQRRTGQALPSSGRTAPYSFHLGEVALDVCFLYSACFQEKGWGKWVENVFIFLDIFSQSVCVPLLRMGESSLGKGPKM